MERPPYRKSARPPANRDLVTLRSYPQTVAAETDRQYLEAQGIPAFVFDGLSYDPLLAASSSGVLLRVAADDVERAEEVLALSSTEESAGEDDEDEVRCPRCELSYCFFETPVSRGPGGANIAAMLAFFFGKKRWVCHKCEHVWDDPKEGPKRVTRLDPGDPRPTFRLRRHRAGTGLFFGIPLGFGAAMLAVSIFGRGAGLGSLIPFTVVLLGIPYLGWRLGKAMRRDVCSVPDCRAPLLPGAEECRRCKSSVAGEIHSGPEHFAAAADFRRELAALKALPPKKKKKKKPRAVG